MDQWIILKYPPVSSNMLGSLFDDSIVIRCRKNARRCGAKHISKSKVLKVFEPLFDDSMAVTTPTRNTTTTTITTIATTTTSLHFNYHYNYHYNYNYSSTAIITATSTTLCCLQPLVGPSVGSLCDPSVTATKLL